MIKHIARLLMLILPIAAGAATTAVVTPGDWSLYRSSTLLQTGFTSVNTCVAAAQALNVTRTYTCRTQTTVAVTATATPQTCTTTKPADETRTMSCPAGTVGTWLQSRTYVAAAYPTCWTATPWTPTAAPGGACSTPPPADTDGDGIPDSSDACPTLYALTPNGCPASTSTPRTYGFDGTENPLVEGGAVVQTGLAGIDWTAPQSRNGYAFTGQTRFDSYNDSIALFYSASNNYRLTATVHFAGSRSSSTSSHEIELIARGNFAPHKQQLYEANIGYGGSSGWYAQIIRMDGVIGAYADIGNVVSQIPPVHDGDKFVFEIIGNTMNSYLNGVKLVTATDSTYASGLPGIGFFWRGTENGSDFGIADLTIEEK